MEIVFSIAGALCLIYFFVIVLYSGISTSFCGVWVFFALILVLMAFFCHRTKHHKGRLPQRFPVTVFTTFFAGIAVFLALMVPVLRYASAEAEADCDYVVVLGARITRSGLSSTLTKRLDRAYAYYLENPKTVFVLSGGQEKDEPVPEAFAMYNYLYRKGMPAENMRAEIQSRHTEENIRFSAAAIRGDLEKRRLPQEMGKLRIGIITNDFHMFRAVRIAEQAGYQNICPITADSDRVLFLHQCVRESAAILKDHIMGHMSIRPEDIRLMPPTGAR